MHARSIIQTLTV